MKKNLHLLQVRLHVTNLILGVVDLVQDVPDISNEVYNLFTHIHKFISRVSYQKSNSIITSWCIYFLEEINNQTRSNNLPKPVSLQSKLAVPSKNSSVSSKTRTKESVDSLTVPKMPKETPIKRKKRIKEVIKYFFKPPSPWAWPSNQWTQRIVVLS